MSKYIEVKSCYKCPVSHAWIHGSCLYMEEEKSYLGEYWDKDKDIIHPDCPLPNLETEKEKKT